MTELLIMMGAPAGEGGSSTQSTIFLVLLLIVFYVFMILPQSRKRKKEMKFRQEIGKGTKIVTIGGLHGKITDEDKDGKTFDIETLDGSKIRIQRASISLEATKEAYPQSVDEEVKK